MIINFKKRMHVTFLEDMMRIQKKKAQKILRKQFFLLNKSQ